MSMKDSSNEEIIFPVVSNLLAFPFAIFLTCDRQQK